MSVLVYVTVLMATVGIPVEVSQGPRYFLSLATKLLVLKCVYSLSAIVEYDMCTIVENNLKCFFSIITYFFPSLQLVVGCVRMKEA